MLRDLGSFTAVPNHWGLFKSTDGSEQLHNPNLEGVHVVLGCIPHASSQPCPVVGRGARVAAIVPLVLTNQDKICAAIRCTVSVGAMGSV